MLEGPPLVSILRLPEGEAQRKTTTYVPFSDAHPYKAKVLVGGAVPFTAHPRSDFALPWPAKACPCFWEVTQMFKRPVLPGFQSLGSCFSGRLCSSSILQLLASAPLRHSQDDLFPQEDMGKILESPVSHRKRVPPSPK